MMGNKNFQEIIRICRTWPTEKYEGVGLHAYNYSKFINIPTTIFVKDIKKEDKPLLIKNIKIKIVNYKDLLLKKNKINNIKLFLLGITKLRGELIMFFSVFGYLSKNLKAKSLIHIHSANYTFCGFFISLIFKIPLIMQVGGTDINRIENSLIHRLILKKINFYVCVNNQISEQIKLINPNAKILIVGNSADLKIFKADKKNRNILTSISNLRWQKNLPLLLNAFKQFIKVNPKAKLNIFGEGPEREKLEKKIIDLKLENNVFLRGYCNHDEISKTLSKTYIYIQSSISEGFPKAIVEAISSGCPIIATNVGSCKEMANKYGILVESNNTEELAFAIKKLYLDNKLWYRYSNLCMKDRESFNWEKLVTKVFKFYISIYS